MWLPNLAPASNTGLLPTPQCVFGPPDYGFRRGAPIFLVGSGVWGEEKYILCLQILLTSPVNKAIHSILVLGTQEEEEEGNLVNSSQSQSLSSSGMRGAGWWKEFQSPGLDRCVVPYLVLRFNAVWWFQRLVKRTEKFRTGTDDLTCLHCGLSIAGSTSNSGDPGCCGESFSHILECTNADLVALRARSLDRLFRLNASLSSSLELKERYLMGSWSHEGHVPQHCSPEFLEQFTPFVRGFLDLRASALGARIRAQKEGDSSLSPSLGMALGGSNSNLPQDSIPSLE